MRVRLYHIASAHAIKYIKFGKYFEKKFLNQGINENRSIEESLDLGWKLLSLLPKEELSRIDNDTISKRYVEGSEEIFKQDKKINLLDENNKSEEDEEDDDED